MKKWWFAQLLAWGLLVGTFLVLSPVLVHGQQPVPNPTGAEFTPSPDHAAIDSYQIGYFLAGAAEPTTLVDLGKPVPDAGNLCQAPINVMPLTFGDYTAKIRARVGTVWSEWSDPSNPFARIPGRPGGPVVKK